ncbi:arabinan endo-1,5-alpha-L-arabinosidase [Streptomyces griseorubens]
MKDVDGDLVVHRSYDGNGNGTPELGVNQLDQGSGRPGAY